MDWASGDPTLGLIGLHICLGALGFSVCVHLNLIGMTKRPPKCIRLRTVNSCHLGKLCYHSLIFTSLISEKWYLDPLYFCNIRGL